MNEHDSETIAGMLREEGCAETDSRSGADIAVINTCSIRENADKRFFGTLGQLKKIKEKNPDYMVCVCGCMNAAGAYKGYHKEKVSMGGHSVRHS